MTAEGGASFGERKPKVSREGAKVLDHRQRMESRQTRRTIGVRKDCNDIVEVVVVPPTLSILERI